MPQSKKKGKIDLTIGKHKLLPPVRHLPVIPGEGERDIEFPDDLAEQTVKQARTRAGKIKVTKQAEGGEGNGLLFRPGTLGSIWDVLRPKPVVPAMPDPDFQALLNGADAIQRRMLSRQFDDIMEQIFGDLEDTATWGVAHMDASIQPSLQDHRRNVGALRAQVESALPQVITELSRRNPGVPPGAILKHAVEMLAKQLGPIVSVLSVYSAAIAQYRSGKFKRQLQALNQYMDACYRLWLNGDVEGVAPGAPQQIPASSLKVGARLLSMVGGPGLGTIPGAKGPVGLSLLMYPLDMLDWISLALTLNSHEGGHQIFADINNFEAEMQDAVQKAVIAATSSGSLTFTRVQSVIGSSRVPTRDLIIKMITDCIGEIEADVAGMLVNGPAFLDGMLMSFPAMLIRDGRVKDAKQLLRTSSVYMMEQQPDGSMSLEFEPHPPDYIRAYIVAAMAEEMGHKAHADDRRKLADKMVGKLPDSLTWEDASGESSTVISIKVADIKAMAPVVAKALIRTKLPSLGNKSLSDLVLWGARQQTKAVALKNILLAGGSDLPKDQGSLYPTLIGSAAAMAYWEAVQSQDANKVLPVLEENVLKMMEALRA